MMAKDSPVKRRLTHRAPPSARPTGQSGRAGGSLRVFEQFSWLEAGSVKSALSRPGRAPGWCPIPPSRIEPVEITSGYPYRVLTQTPALSWLLVKL